MSGSVWYLSVSRKKIEFKKYPKKKKRQPVFNKKGNKIKGLLINILFFSTIILFSSLISAAEINDTFHINVQTTFSNGTIQSGTFAFAFNITESSNSSCLGPIVYNHSTSQATDTRGIVSIYLPTIGSGGGNLSSLSFDKQYYLCYYRDGTLKDVSQLGRVPYSFRATQVNLSEVSIDSNLTLGSFNVSASSGFFTFLGSLASRISKIFATDADISNNLVVGRNLTVSNGTLFVNNNTGRVGINTISPAEALDIIGTIQATGPFQTTGNEIIYAGSPLGQVKFFRPSTTNDIALYAGGLERVRINGSQGNVGINITNPQNILHVFGDANITGATYLLNSKCASGEVLTANTTTGLVSCVTDQTGAGSFDLNITSEDGSGVITDAEIFNITGNGTANIRTYMIGNDLVIEGTAGGGGITGSGTSGFIARFNGTTSINNSLIFENGSSIGVNTTIPGTAALNVSGLIFGSNGLTISAGTVSLPAGEIGAFEIAASAINTTHILDNTILAGDIAASAINTTHIVDFTILGTDISFASINASKILASAINTTHILDATIGAIDIAASVINTTHILDNTILAQDIAFNQINASHIVASSINTTHILDNTILDDDIAGSQINTTHILDATILGQDIKFAQINASHILASAINTTHILDNTILTIDLSSDVNTSLDTRYLNDDGDTATGNYTFDTSTFFIDSTNDRIGIGTTTPQNKLNVIGDGNFTGKLYFGDLATNVLSLIEPIYIRGTGLNNNANRVLKIGNTTQYDTGSGRGLRLTKLWKANHTVLFDTTYDTYNLSTESDTLAAALNNMTNAEIGVLTSFDAWENNVSANLDTAFGRKGLYKAQVSPNSGSRRPYAAIFESASNNETSDKAAECLYDDTTNQSYCEIRGFLIDGSFTATGTTKNALTNTQGNLLAVVADENANVGIGTTSPQQKLNVVGDANITGLLRFGSLPASSINATYVAGGSINTTHILDNTLLAQDIAQNAINTTHILDNTILAQDIAASAINTTHILDATIGAIDLAASSVNTTHILDNTILVADLNSAINSSYARLDAANTFGAFNQTFDTNIFFIDSNNNRVGIGTASPQNTLNVVGTANFTGNTTSNTDFCIVGGNCLSGVGGGGGSGTITGAGTSGRIARFNGTTSINDSVIFENGSNIGIGTASPADILELVKNAVTGPRLYLTNEHATSKNAALRFASTSSSTLNWDITTDFAGNGGTELSIVGSDGLQKMTFLQSGNVGIGTTNPSNKLEINGTSTNTTEPQLRIFNNNSGIGNASGIRLRTGSGWDVKLQTVQDVNWLELTAGNGDVQHSWSSTKFYPGASSLGGTRTGYISGDGTNVGIGTTSPAQILTVNLTSGNVSFIQAGTQRGEISIDAQANIHFGNPQGATFIDTVHASDNDITFRAGTTLIERMRIDGGTGNVGIGTTSPIAKLHVNGSGDFPQLRVNNEVNTYNESGIRFRDFNATGGVSMHADIFINATGSETGSMGFRVPFTDERLTILSTGNVGINDATPDFKLDVEGNVSLNGKFGPETGLSDGVTRGFWLWSITDSNHVIYSAASTGTSPAGANASDGIWDAGHRMRFRTATGQGFLFENNAETALVDIDSDNGNIRTIGDIDIDGGDLLDGGANFFSTSGCGANTGVSTVGSDGLITCVADTGTGTMSSWLLAASGTAGTESITDGETVTFTAGTGISSTRSTNTITITNTGDTNSGDDVLDGTAGDWEIASSTNSTPYTTASIELREATFGGSTFTPPRLSFHWGGVVASQIAIESNGRIAIRDNPGTGYENLVASDITASGGNIIWGSTDISTADIGIVDDGVIALITETSGNFVGDVAAGAAITVTGTPGEGYTETVAITADAVGDTQLAFNTGQTLTTAGTPQFARLGLGAAADGTYLLNLNGALVHGTSTGVGIGTTTPTGGKLNIVGGNLNMSKNNITGVTKITFETGGGTDPPYRVGDTVYSTYGPFMVGAKEEVTGIVQLNSSYVIDFTKLEIGSDLWLFNQVTDFGKNWENLQVILTPGFDGRVWYTKNPANKTLTIYGTQAGEVSYRLTGNGFTWGNRSNIAIDLNPEAYPDMAGRVKVW